MVQASSTEIRHLLQRALKTELISSGDLVADGLPGVPDRAVKALANGLRRDIPEPRIADLVRREDAVLWGLPGVGARTIEQIRDGLTASLAEEEARREEESRVTWEVLGPRHTTPLQGEMADVSNPCREGRHYRCSGKIALQQLRHGQRYARCKCPFCAETKDPSHIGKIRRMPLKY